MKYLLSLMLVLIIFSEKLDAQDTKNNSNQRMKRFIVERTFPEGLNIPVNEKGSEICLDVVSTNSEDRVSWVHSYVSDDKKKTFCIYDAPSADHIRTAAVKNGLPVDKVTEVRVLDPYFYK
jgi:hypothetical protein